MRRRLVLVVAPTLIAACGAGAREPSVAVAALAPGRLAARSTTSATLDGLGDPRTDDAPLVFFEDAEGTRPIARLWGGGGTWERLPLIEGALGVVSSGFGVHVRGWAKPTQRTYFTRSPIAVHAPHAVIPAHASVRFVRAIDEHDVVVRAITGLASPATIDAIAPSVALASRDDEFDPDVFTAARRVDAENPGPWVTTRADRVKLAGAPRGGAIFELGARDATFSRLEERDGFVHVRRVGDDLTLEGWIASTEVVDAPASAVTRRLRVDGGHGCTLYARTRVVRATHEIEVRMGTTPDAPGARGTADAGFDLYVEPDAVFGAWIGVWTHGGIGALEGEHLWVRASDVEDVPL